ncbi:hypothetical protein [Pseudonocardia sp. NPDC049154]|uniref:hypothetical protein n=1 Tax=Pseudonocardia sp. NPDC049154 TaxID=3155501 RepID=UPI0033CDE741
MTRRLWPAWLTAVIGSFAVLEYLALGPKLFPPLSCTLRRLLGIHPRRWWRRPATAAFTAFWCWLTVHLIRVTSGEAP